MPKQPSLDALARDLTADPPRPVDPAALAAADPDDLSAALRRSVADLDAATQRTRLAAAFAAIATAATPAGATSSPAADAPVAATLPRMRVLTPVRIGLASALVAVSAIAGVVLGIRTEADPAPAQAADAAPVEVVTPIAVGPAPSKEFIRGMQAADEEAAAAAEEKIRQQHPDDIQLADPDSATGGGEGGEDDELAGAGDPGSAIPGEGAGRADPGAADDAGDDRPGLVDLCAGPTPVEGCDGVGGTVTAAQIRPFELLDAPEAWVSNPCESTAGPLEDDEFVFYLQASYLGDYTIRYRPVGSDAPYTEVTTTSDDSWRAALDAGYGAVLDCVAAPRPSAEATTLQVEVTGVGLDDSGTDTFSGVVELGAPDPASTVQRRDGRPPVQVTALTSSALEVIVPVGREEDAEVTLRPSEPGAERSTCAVADPPKEIDGTQVTAGVRRADGEEITLEWTPQRYHVVADEPGHWAVCVTWLDDGEPPEQLERAAIAIDIASISRYRILMAGYMPASSSEQQPDSVNVRVNLPDGECGSVRVESADFDYAPNRVEAPTVCDIDGAPAYVGARLEGHFGEETRTQRALIRMPGTCATEEVYCRAWVLLNLRSEDGSLVTGSAVLGIEMPRDGRETVAIGDERPVLTEEPEISGARLRWGQVSVTPQPGAPAKALRVRWATDEPARVLLTAMPLNDSPACPVRRTTRSRLAPRGTTTIGGLCPGMEYLVAFDLMNDAGRTIYNARGAGGLTGVDVHYRSAAGRTRPLEALLDYRLEFQMTLDGEPFNAGIVPTLLELGFPTGPGHPDHSYRWSQWYDGTARAGLDCSVAAHYNRAGSGVPVQLRGGTYGPNEAYWVFNPYTPTRLGIGQTTVGGWSCPSLANQVNHTPSSDRVDCAMVITGLVPERGTNQVLRMLSGREAHYTASALCGHEVTMNVRLTVTLREAPSVLRGGG